MATESDQCFLIPRTLLQAALHMSSGGGLFQRPGELARAESQVEKNSGFLCEFQAEKW